MVSFLFPRMPRQTPKIQSTVKNGTPRVWVLQDGQPKAIEIRTGATNGRMTEVIGEPLRAGMEVITETVSGSTP